MNMYEKRVEEHIWQEAEDVVEGEESIANQDIYLDKELVEHNAPESAEEWAVLHLTARQGMQSLKAGTVMRSKLERRISQADNHYLLAFFINCSN